MSSIDPMMIQAGDNFSDLIAGENSKHKIEVELRNCGVFRTKIDNLLIKHKHFIDNNEHKMFKDKIHEINAKIRDKYNNDLEELKDFVKDLEKFHDEWKKNLESRK